MKFRISYLVLISVLLVVNQSLSYSSDNYEIDGIIILYDDNENILTDSTKAKIDVNSSKCELNSENGFIYDGIYADGLFFDYNTIKNMVVVQGENYLQIEMCINSNNLIAKIITSNPTILFEKINYQKNYNDAYEESCIIKCRGSNGIIFDSEEGIIRLTIKDCTLKLNNSDKVISYISFPVEQIKNIELKEDKNLITFHSCDSKVCDKYIEITSPKVKIIKNMIIHFQNKNEKDVKVKKHKNPNNQVELTK